MQKSALYKIIVRSFIVAGAFLACWSWCLCSFGATAATPSARSCVAILNDSAVGVDPFLADTVANAMRREGLEPVFLSADAVCNYSDLSSNKFFLFVIPNAKSYPVAGCDVLMQYLRTNGNLLVLGRPPFDNPLSKIGGRFVDAATVDKEVAKKRLPPIETVTPGYKLYSLTDVASLKAVTSQCILDVDCAMLPAPASASACYARPEGKGFDCGYRWRWIPLITAHDRDGVNRGVVAWITLNQASQQVRPEGFADATERLYNGRPWQRMPSLEGSACAVCAISDAHVLQKMADAGVFGEMARRIADGLFLSYAGTEFFSYWPDETVKLGAVAVNNGIRTARLSIRIRISPLEDKKTVFEQEAEMVLKPGQYGKQEFEWRPKNLSTDRYIVTTELRKNGKIIDEITHELGILSADKPSPDEFVTVRDGDFWLRGKQWYPVGVNYWPRYAIGLEPDDYTYHWLAPGFYNPEEVERDLVQLESLGANFVAIRANAQHDGRNLLDFLRRCKAHAIRVLLFLHSHVITDEPHYFQGVMMPYHFQQEVVADFLRSNRLADNPAILGYDLIWEPAGWVFGGRIYSFGWTDPTPYRQRWDNAWASWIEDRYGSVANAEADWGMPIPRRDGVITSPSDKQFSNDGPWRVMLAAYRRFMDDLMSRYWNDTVRTLRRMDPNHLVSFRQGNVYPKDFTLTATLKHVDFFAMEGYSYSLSERDANAAGFTNCYLRSLLDGRPFMWLEYGCNTCPKNAIEANARQLDIQAKTIEMIHREALKNGASGIAPWWWPGGYRVSEQSDYGIINPDGTPRPSTLVFQEYAKQFKSSRDERSPNEWFTLDRDSHAGGNWHIIFHDGAEAYRQAVKAGKTLGVRTPGAGKTSGDAPLLAVGNTKYNGRNPPKHLNAEFNWFKIKADGGPWIEVSNGATIQVPKGKAIFATASIGNLQDAKWLTPAGCQGKPGAVFMAATSKSQLKLKQAIPQDTARLKDAVFDQPFRLTDHLMSSAQVELQMMAEGRAWFGEKMRFTLEPSAP